MTIDLFTYLTNSEIVVNSCRRSLLLDFVVVESPIIVRKTDDGDGDVAVVKTQCAIMVRNCRRPARSTEEDLWGQGILDDHCQRNAVMNERMSNVVTNF